MNNLEMDEDGEAFFNDTPETETEIHLQQARLKALPSTAKFKQIKLLNIRQNTIASINEFIQQSNSKDITDIDAYDNRIPTVTGLERLEKLRSLDLSFNLIKDVPELPSTSLQELYLIQNSIHQIPRLCLPHLTILELGGNKIKEIQGLESCVNLKELWLGKNRIQMLQGLNTLKQLRLLSIQSNRIHKIEGLEDCAALEEVYLANNGISKIEGLDANINLKILDVGSNRISSIENLTHLTTLEEFWASNNQLSSFNDLVPLQKLSLDTIYLEGNPLHTVNRSDYRRKVKLMLPNIKHVDAVIGS